MEEERAFCYEVEAEKVPIERDVSQHLLCSLYDSNVPCISLITKVCIHIADEQETQNQILAWVQKQVWVQDLTTGTEIKRNLEY